MVRVLAIADEEEPAYASRIAALQVDAVVVAGDLPWDYVADVVQGLGAPAAYVPGNHDPVFGHGEPDSPTGTVNIDLRVQRVAGLWVGGLGGSVWYNGGHHQFTQEQFEQRADRLLASASAHGLERLDVVVTHAPPRGLGDEPDPTHVGIEALNRVIDRLQPTWHLHGHIHPYGMRKPDRTRGTTTVRNVIPWTVMDIEPHKEG